MELNIGLNNNPLTFDQISETLAHAFGAKSKLMVGSYEGATEPTVVVKCPRALTPSELLLITMLCTQECIAVWHDDEGWLVKNPEHDVPYNFDRNFFIHF